jgi:hypothetical protein
VTVDDDVFMGLLVFHGYVFTSGMRCICVYFAGVQGSFIVYCFWGGLVGGSGVWIPYTSITKKVLFDFKLVEPGLDSFVLHITSLVYTSSGIAIILYTHFFFRKYNVVKIITEFDQVRAWTVPKICVKNNSTHRASHQPTAANVIRPSKT